MHAVGRERAGRIVTGRVCISHRARDQWRGQLLSVVCYWLVWVVLDCYTCHGFIRVRLVQLYRLQLVLCFGAKSRLAAC